MLLMHCGGVQTTNVVVERIMSAECSCVHACVRPEQTLLTLLARYLGYLLMEPDLTFTTNRLCGKDKHVKFWGQKVNGQGQNALFGLVVVTCWQRRNSRRSRNHHLVQLW